MPEMTVESALVIELVQQRTQVAEVWSQLFGRHRGVIPPVPLRRRAGRKRRSSGARFTNLPYASCLLLGVKPRGRRARQRCHALDEAAGGLLTLAGIVGAEFNE